MSIKKNVTSAIQFLDDGVYLVEKGGVKKADCGANSGHCVWNQ